MENSDRRRRPFIPPHSSSNPTQDKGKSKSDDPDPLSMPAFQVGRPSLLPRIRPNPYQALSSHSDSKVILGKKRKLTEVDAHPLPVPPVSTQALSSQSNSQMFKQVKKEKANWDENTTRIFCQVCAEEVYKGNRPHTHFSKKGWWNVVEKFAERSQKKYDQPQLKNKWEKLKSEYTAWLKLTSHTGLGWNHDKNTVDADDAWWEKQDSSILAFRYGGIKNLKELEVMFSKTIASHELAWNPYDESQFEPDNESTFQDYDKRDEEIDDTNNDPTYEVQEEEVVSEEQVSKKGGSSSGAKRRSTQKGKKSKVSTASVLQSELDRIAGASESCSQTVASILARKVDPPGCSIGECLKLLSTIPEAQIGSEFYMLGTRLFLKREYREMFVNLPSEVRAAWLAQELARERK